MVFKKDLTPLTKGGSITKHRGKGSAAAPMPNRNSLSKLTKNPAANSINDYAKASPTAGSADPTSEMSGGYGLGTGNWSGNGM